MKNRIVLMYHDVYCFSEKESGFQFPTSFPYKISADKFEGHVSFAYNYCKQNKIPLETIEFTFDDGGESFYRVIAPILEKYGFKGVFFISTSYIDTDKFLTKEQIESLYKRGHIIASHSHPRNMAKLSEMNLLAEWEESIKILEDIVHSSITMASIPSGYSSQSVIRTAAKSGIKILYTSKPTDKVTVTKDIEMVGRYVIHCNTSLDIVRDIISSEWKRKELFIRWNLIAIAKRILGTNYNKIKKRIIQ